jgi:hypothetical protein
VLQRSKAKEAEILRHRIYRITQKFILKHFVFCVFYYHRVSTQLQLYIYMYHIISYNIIYQKLKTTTACSITYCNGACWGSNKKIISYHIIYHIYIFSYHIQHYKLMLRRCLTRVIMYVSILCIRFITSDQTLSLFSSEVRTGSAQQPSFQNAVIK